MLRLWTQILQSLLQFTAFIFISAPPSCLNPKVFSRANYTPYHHTTLFDHQHFVCIDVLLLLTTTFPCSIPSQIACLGPNLPLSSRTTLISSIFPAWLNCSCTVIPRIKNKRVLYEICWGKARIDGRNRPRRGHRGSSLPRGLSFGPY